MSVLSVIANLFFTDVRITTLSLVAVYVTYRVTKLYVRRLALPPGPLPLPFVGNALVFKKDNWSTILEQWAKRYGPVMTLWMAEKPVIVISDIEVAKDAFRKNELAGRTDNIMVQLINNDGHTGIIFSNGNTWEAMRKVSHPTVVKFAGTERLTDIVLENVDHTIETMVKRETLGRPFDPFDYIYNLCVNIHAVSGVSARFELDDPAYKAIRYMHKDLFDPINKSAFFWDLFPCLKKIDPRYYKLKATIVKLQSVVKQLYDQRLSTYSEADTRDLCDALIGAQKSATRETAEHLNDTNLALILFDVLIAGTDAAQMGFRWVLLHMLYDKTIEKKLRQEVESEIGDRMPTLEDTKRCHYVMAFMSEVLRFDSVVPIGIPHEAVDNTTVGDYRIPKGQEVVIFGGHIMHSAQHFDDPLVFRPERFLSSDGQYVATRHKAFIPFGTGRRICLGEKLALSELFLALVRFVQKTSGFEITLHTDGQSDVLRPDLDRAVHFIPYTLHYQPKPFKILLNKK